MKVEIEKTFPMPGSADVAWTMLQDIEAVAGCMPGAKITDRLPDGGYKGTVTVRMGPATMSFRGEVAVSEVDGESRSLRLVGKGTDSTGTSGASMDLVARIDALDGQSSKLVGKSEVSMSGKAAAFGGRMMNSVADQILKQFAGNFAKKVSALAEQRDASVAADASGAGDASGASGASGVSTDAAAKTGDTAAAATTSAAATAAADPGGERATSAPGAGELNGLALIWGMFKDWLRGLFGKKSA